MLEIHVLYIAPIINNEIHVAFSWQATLHNVQGIRVCPFILIERVQRD